MKPPRKFVMEMDQQKNEASLNLMFNDIYKRFAPPSKKISLSPIPKITTGDVGIMGNLLPTGQPSASGMVILPNDITPTEAVEVAGEAPAETTPSEPTRRNIFRRRLRR
jgi:hypothetical protein